MNLLCKVCALLNCSLSEVDFHLRNPDTIAWLTRVLRRNYQLETIHLKNNIQLKFEGFSLFGAHQQFAYNGYLGTTVQQHMHSRHRIHLNYPRLPCVCSSRGNHHCDYFPIELIWVKRVKK